MQKTISFLAHIQYERLFVYVELLLVGVFGALYMYYLVVAVAEVALREQAQYAIADTEERIRALEGAYLAHQETLTPELLSDYNLVAAAPSGYVQVPSAGAYVTRRD